jgi:protein O-GlcNAc transferase
MPTPGQQQILDHMAAGRFEQARALLARLLQKSPDDPDGNAAMCLVLWRLGRGEQALFYGQRAVALAPDNPNFLRNLGSVLVQLGRLDAALEAYDRACALHPAHASAHVGGTDVLLKMVRPLAALRRADQAAAYVDWDVRLLGNRAAAFVQLGRSREAVELFRQGVQRDPDNLILVGGLAGNLQFVHGVPPEEVLRSHQRYGMLLERAFPNPLPPVRPAGPERTLRVGLLSPDLRAHSVGFFAYPFLDLGPGFELICYSTSGVEDAVSAHYRSKATAWRAVSHLDHRALAEQIRADGVDVLVELSGLTEGHRLPTMRLRPAPVQVNAIGYPGTTGMRQIDYRLVDSHTDPPGDADRLAVERLLRLDPCFLCYRPPERAPEPRVEPGAPITFGSFSALTKLDEVTIRLWARVLEASPETRLLYKAFALKDPEVRAATLQRFLDSGVQADRLELMGPLDLPGEHLEQYRRVHVALDTFPYHGTTTTCEALLMGVPVVTLAGATHVSRVGVSLLGNAGLPELIARDEDEFVRIATGLARDPARLSALRTGLRERFLGSVICDAPSMSARLAHALRGIWRDACAST